MSKLDAKLITYQDYTNKRTNIFMYVRDIKYSLDYYNLDTKGKKPLLLERLNTFFKNLNRYEKYIDIINLVQAKIKGNYIRKNYFSRGPGFLNKKLCNNDEDFYTFEHKNDIDNNYFFSYKDTDGFIYFFDIRSFKTLIENKGDNPYNRKEIPFNAIKAMEFRLNQLEKQNLLCDHEKTQLTPEQEYTQKVLSIFQKIDQLNSFAGGTQVDWFHNLSFVQLKNFYKVLEDIWNYRSELTIDQKRDIVPNNDVFKHNMSKVLHLPHSKKRKLQNIILDDIDKLISSSESEVHRSTGSYYVLIALVEVSIECANQMPWLIQVQ